MLDTLTKWLKVGTVTEALKVTMDKDVWKVMITFATEHGTFDLLMLRYCQFFSNTKAHNLPHFVESLNIF